MQIPLFRFFEEAEDTREGRDPGLGAARWVRPGILALVPGWVSGGAGWGAQGPWRPGWVEAGAQGPSPGGDCQR